MNFARKFKNSKIEISDENMNPSARRKARELALQAIYQWQFTADSAPDIEVQFSDSTSANNIDQAYFRELLRGVIEHKDILDENMGIFLDRPLKDLNPVELAVLRLAIYELAYRLDVPYKVAINEALELTKKFGSIEGFKYVNGILDKVARRLRKAEFS